ncbi:acyl carrier protein [Streptomyces sp. URMC 126]|uniref:acyl carrier protein n=1 Tax=Streptomyces sp. URMC 126 TaxID=3423401 RepID=UPI003F1AEC11
MPDLTETLLGILEKNFGIDRTEMTPASTLADLEIGSLARAELALILRDDLGVTMTENDVPEHSTVHDVAALVASRLPASRLAADGRPSASDRS